MNTKLVRKLRRQVIIPVQKRLILDTERPDKKTLVYMNKRVRALGLTAWLKKHRPEFYLDLRKIKGGK